VLSIVYPLRKTLSIVDQQRLASTGPAIPVSEAKVPCTDSIDISYVTANYGSFHFPLESQHLSRSVSRSRFRCRSYLQDALRLRLLRERGARQHTDKQNTRADGLVHGPDFITGMRAHRRLMSRQEACVARRRLARQWSGLPC